MHRIAPFASFALLTSFAAMAQELTDPEVFPEYVAEAEAITANRRVQQAMEHIVAIEPQSREDLVELTEIPAPPFEEQARAERFAEMLRESGLTDVTIDDVGNAIGRRPGRTGNRVIAYSAHLDTVFPSDTDVTVRYDDEKMYAPGIGDNTRGLVTILGVLRAMEHAGIETEADVLFVGNVGEEGLGDLRGVKHLFRDGAEKIDTLIAVDGGESTRIVYGGVGSHRYKITFQGPGGHSWGAFGLANPHHALGRAIQIFDENAPTVTSVGEKTSYNIGRIGGGTSINSIPFESWMEVDMRSGSQDKLDDIDEVLKAAVEQALQEENAGRLDGPELTVDVDRVGTRPAAEGDSTSPVVQRAMAATLAFGVQPSLRISSTDSNLPISKGIPAVTMSRGGVSGNSHSPDEWWQNVDGHIGIQIGLVTLLAEAGLAN
ncbi:MAG: M20/M25/M40 family metallo-hydrolase [Proteobacteria bacterium]|nr:M20/M25/M40 family metallo-hydrolase [Pseudomonadota bacterium]MDA0992545.1 M20/M25/M40 family metallo-hydrolase [Pseudomonadota bacterium]